MSKLFIIFMTGVMMFSSIALMILGMIGSITEISFSGKFGGMAIFVAGFLILLASIGMLDSGLRIVELTENGRSANK